MPELYHDGEEDVNSETPRPSYYAIIPASVRYHADLSPAAKLFYGELTALSSVHGFVWASNTYFMKLYNVSRQTVKNWLSALSAAGFIRVQYTQATNDRKIFLTETEGVERKVAGGSKKSVQPQPENLAQSIKENIKESITNVNVVHGGLKFVEPGPVPARDLNGKKGSASPPPVDVPDSIEEVIALTGDAGSRARFRQLWEIVVKHHREQDWRVAVDATRTALEGARKPVERPGAYFQGVLAARLETAGVRMPMGSRSERAEIQRVIARSLAAADVAAAPVGGDSRPPGPGLGC